MLTNTGYRSHYLNFIRTCKRGGKKINEHQYDHIHFHYAVSRLIQQHISSKQHHDKGYSLFLKASLVCSIVQISSPGPGGSVSGLANGYGFLPKSGAILNPLDATAKAVFGLKLYSTILFACIQKSSNVSGRITLLPVGPPAMLSNQPEQLVGWIAFRIHNNNAVILNSLCTPLFVLLTAAPYWFYKRWWLEKWVIDFFFRQSW